MRSLDSNRVWMKDITASLVVRVGEWFGASAELDVESVELRQYPNSFMLRYRVRTGDSQPALLVKIPRKPSHRVIGEALKNDYLREHTREYYDFMFAIWRAFERASDEHGFAIHPLEYFEKWNAIAMLEAEGRSLKSMTFLGAPPKTSRFLDHLKNAARWLRVYHERVGELRFETFPRAEIEARLDALLADLSRNSRGEVDTASIRTSLLSAVVDDWRVLVARTHDDFHYSNILISSDGRACGLDARRRSRREPIYIDLATLILDPETRVGSILTGGLLLSRKFLAKGRQSILEGYFVGDPHEDAILNFYCALAVIDKWMINERRFHTGAAKYVSFFLRPWVRKYFFALLKRYQARLSHPENVQ